MIRAQGSPIANNPPFEVLLPTDIVDDLLGRRIVKHAVDGEIPPLGMFFRRAEHDAAGMPSVAIVGIAAKRGNLHLPCLGITQHHDHAISRPDSKRAPRTEDAANFVRLGVAGHVVVARRAAQELIPNTTATQ